MDPFFPVLVVIIVFSILSYYIGFKDGKILQDSKYLDESNELKNLMKIDVDLFLKKYVKNK